MNATVRVCRLCEAEKLATDFYTRENGKLRSECKACTGARTSLRSTGWTPEAYEKAFAKQDGKCAICMSTLNSSRYTKFAGDHCHTTGKLRGLLCMNCNTAIGLLKDSTIRLQAAIEYLNRHTLDKEMISPAK